LRQKIMSQHTDYQKYIKPAFLDNPRNKKVMQEIYQEFFPIISRFLVSKNERDEALIKDVFQESLLVVYKCVQKPGFKLTSKFSTFLMGIAFRVWKKSVTKINTTGLTNEIQLKDVSHERLEELQLANKKWIIYHRNINQLGELCQKVIALKNKGKRHAEIASLLPEVGTEENSRARYARCKKKLLELVFKDKEFQLLKKIKEL